ncbi:di-heme-cytochrome C peroxidase [Roseibium porphyridii]|uniref:Di-heme-cytochrome C peroxidase n=1 Tax=Roseibium porphyridii TaxID=2866279 RepID=A0ABY8F812_9HYPH|nr:di-heme-cytochrome C peroxidase [Roseibium sp. KMA01]WFE91529.1 di-heme-cytochrome C peroxidase [Roseibium sp. KMA01]
MKILKIFSLLILAIATTSLSVTASAEECVPASFDGAFDGEITLCQNWDAQAQQEFWFTPQGSRVMPYAWFLALEQAGSQAPFSDSNHLDTFRYLPQKPTPLNPDGLPIGFTRDKIADDDPLAPVSTEWLGLTCSACHTGQIEFNDKKLLIDGAPAMADFEGFMWSLEDALTATVEDEARFERFAEKILGQPTTTAGDKTTLKKQLTELAQTRSAWNELNKGDHEYGFSRLDAIGAIFNAVSVSAQGLDDENGKRANAPVSYPFIWDTPQHDFVQWNASVANEGAGALGRNVGEVLGVFGGLNYNPIDGKLSECLAEDTGFLGRLAQVWKSIWGGLDNTICIGHASSIKADGLFKLEALLWNLQSPEWPEDVLGKINSQPATDNGPSMVERGKALYEQRCLECHDGRLDNTELTTAFKRDDPNRRIEAERVSVEKLGTDAQMAGNFLGQVYPISEEINGQVKAFLPLTFPLTDKHRFSSQGGGAELVSYAVRGVIVNKVLNDPQNTLDAIMLGQPEERRAFLERVQARLVEAQDASNLKRIRILIDAIEEAERDDLIDWVQGLDISRDGILRSKIREILRRNEPSTDGDTSAADAEAARQRLFVYKARPLNGIWATAPYLHNGSIRTMRQLMLPAECPETGEEIDAETGQRLCRQKTFEVGSRTYDPDTLGFIDAGGFVVDTSLPGNSNTGHEYSTRFFRDNPEQLDALLEYIKTL